MFDRTGTETEGLAASSAFVVPNVASMTIAAIIDNRTTLLFIAAIRTLIEQEDALAQLFYQVSALPKWVNRYRSLVAEAGRQVRF